MTIFISISAMLLGLWIIWRLASSNGPGPLTKRDTTWDPPHHYQCRCKVATLPTQARTRGVVLPKDFVGPSYRSQHPHFWGDDEP